MTEDELPPDIDDVDAPAPEGEPALAPVVPIKHAKSNGANGKAAGLEPPWPDIVPLSRAETIPAFPVHALPEWIREWVEAESIATQTPPEMAAVFALASISALICGRLWIQARPGWLEGSNVWLAVVAEPGARKSPVHADATAPVRAIEAERIEEARPRVRRAQREKELLEDEVEKMRHAIKREKSDALREAMKQDYLDKSAELDALEDESEPRLVVGDTTPEKLIAMLGVHKRLAMIADEDSLFGHMLGRYSKAPAPEPFLSAYSNRAIDRDRHSSATVRVTKPALTIATCIQPRLLEGIPEHSMLSGRGFVDRFAFIVLRDLVGRRDMNPPPVPTETRERYERGLRAIADAFGGDEKTVELDATGHAALNYWLEQVEQRRGPAGDFADVRGFAGKLDGLVVRFAGILHVAKREKSKIDALTIREASQICEALAEHHRAALDLIGADKAMADARTVLAWAVATGTISFTGRDFHRTRSRWKEDRFNAAISVLVRTGHARQMKVLPGRSGGRPTLRYVVRPEVLAAPLPPLPQPKQPRLSLTEAHANQEVSPSYADGIRDQRLINSLSLSNSPPSTPIPSAKPAKTSNGEGAPDDEDDWDRGAQ